MKKMRISEENNMVKYLRIDKSVKNNYENFLYPSDMQDGEIKRIWIYVSILFKTNFV